MTTTTRRQLAERLYGPGVGCGAASCVFGRAAGVTTNGACACRRQYLTAGRLARMVDAALAGDQESQGEADECLVVRLAPTMGKSVSGVTHEQLAQESQTVQPEAPSDWPALPEGYRWDEHGWAIVRGAELGGIVVASGWPSRWDWRWHGQALVTGDADSLHQARLRLAWHAWDEAV